jgi:2-haloacid dehalogenase
MRRRTSGSPSQPYTWLVFDADDTLFDYERAEAAAVEKAFAQFGLPFTPSYLALYHQINAQLWRAFEQKQITQGTLRVRRFEALFEALSLGPLPPAFSTAYLGQLATCTQLVAGAEALLKTLHVSYHIAILTNGLTAVQRPRLLRSAICDYVAELVISEEVGAAKPDSAIFEIAFDRMGRPPRAEVLMIGDSLTSDIQGAIQYGLDTCWYNPAHRPRPAGLEITYEMAALSELEPLLVQLSQSVTPFMPKPSAANSH